MKRSIYSLTFLLTLATSASLIADDHASIAPGDGAFMTIMVKAPNPQAYIKAIKENESVFKTSGASASGYCLTKTGNDYAGQMFAWNGFESVEKAMASLDTYDVYDAPSEFSTLREIQYVAMFKPLKEFKLDPGYERLWRIVVSAENVQPLVAGVAKVEEMIRAQGDDVNIGVFQPIAGGTAETKTLHLRASSRSWAMAGRLTDEFFAGKPWAAAWTETIGLIDTIESDTLEYCELVHSAES